MTVEQLSPLPDAKYNFSFKSWKYVPKQPGCYALATYSGEVLYVGLTVNLYRRFSEHRDTEEKRNPTKLGAAYWFYYLAGDDSEIHRIERGWMNQPLAIHGALPILNKVYSPVR